MAAQPTAGDPSGGTPRTSPRLELEIAILSSDPGPDADVRPRADARPPAGAARIVFVVAPDADLRSYLADSVAARADLAVFAGASLPEARDRADGRAPELIVAAADAIEPAALGDTAAILVGGEEFAAGAEGPGPGQRQLALPFRSDTLLEQVHHLLGALPLGVAEPNT